MRAMTKQGSRKRSLQSDPLLRQLPPQRLLIPLPPVLLQMTVIMVVVFSASAGIAVTGTLARAIVVVGAAVDVEAVASVQLFDR